MIKEISTIIKFLQNKIDGDPDIIIRFVSGDKRIIYTFHWAKHSLGYERIFSEKDISLLLISNARWTKLFVHEINDYYREYLREG